MKVSIIIPVYNEKATVKEIVSRVKKQKIRGTVKEIIIIDDGSTDGSTKIIQKIKGVKKVLFPKNRGKGAAVRAGIKKAAGEYILIQDADLEYDPADYKILLAPIIKGKAKVVYGSRFLGPHKNMFFWHALANQFLSFVTNILYNTTLSDMEVGYKVFPRKLALDLNLSANGFAFEPEITAKILKEGVRIFEVPTTYCGREYSEGKKIKARDALIALFTLIKYRIVD